ncbi:hypothetical protein AVEN_253014-1 [Araneus ventricosus]|uniref:Uncharacterized protein n=1 Tax=Araneus ventricosus TaxID=182803 RepID=A0A4Y2F2K1_ARAVE|nr:hypothetical protein AVEN_253014-1 [Araneus ventricosus]
MITGMVELWNLVPVQQHPSIARIERGWFDGLSQDCCRRPHNPHPFSTSVVTPDIINCNCGTDLWLLYKRAEKTMEQSRLHTHSSTGAGLMAFEPLVFA